MSAVVMSGITSPAEDAGRTRESLIKKYFEEGFEYRIILCFLYWVHGFILSLRHLKRLLKRMKLRRRKALDASSFRYINLLIRRELCGSGSMLGYRAMLKRLRQKYHVVVSRDTVMRLVRSIAPDDTRLRKEHKLQRRRYVSLGPNYVWHIDNYDKLKPYGFSIHGCIDGYSRRILWLEVGTTNSDPEIVAHYFLQCVKKLEGVPCILRTDLGTENSTLSFMQPFLRRNHSDRFHGIESFRYGRSTSNQRIEAWWSVLRRCCTEWWMQLFKGLKEEGLFNETNELHVDCLRFSFMGILQKELHTAAREWNTHRIRPGRNAVSPPGIPDELYFLPQLGGTCDYLHDVDSADTRYLEQFCSLPHPPACLEFLELCQHTMSFFNLNFPHNVTEALDLYLDLTHIIESIL